MVGHHSARDSMKGTLREGSLLGNLNDEVFERYAKRPVNWPPTTLGPCWGTWSGFVCRDF